MGFFRTCSICSSPHAAEINQALAKGVTGEVIAATFHVGEKSVSRHCRNCLSYPDRRKKKNREGLRIPYSECRKVVWFDETAPKHMQSPFPADLAARDDVLIVRVSFDDPVPTVAERDAARKAKQESTPSANGSGQSSQ